MPWDLSFTTVKAGKIIHPQGWRALQFHYFQPINVFHINSVNYLTPLLEHHSSFNYRCQKFLCAAMEIFIFYINGLG